MHRLASRARFPGVVALMRWRHPTAARADVRAAPGVNRLRLACRTFAVNGRLLLENAS